VNHELEHIRQQHWIDLLLFEILRTMQWFNPVCWLYGHLIRQNHEYLADERALQRSSNPAIYRAALLNQMFGGPVISLANSFNYSLNKKRFNMMKHKIESPIRKLKLLVVLPLIAGVFYAFAAPEYKFTQSENTNVVPKGKTISGRVIVEDGKPLKDASILVVEGGIGTVTDANGNFKLEVPDDLPIVISYVGFETQKVIPDFEKEMNITLKPKVFDIEVVGNSISESKSDESPNPSLVFIDGKESTMAVMTSINPSRIDKVNVLKDKMAVEKYGEKGKDGVIEITLKGDNKTSANQTLRLQTLSPLKFGNPDGSGSQPMIVKDGFVVKNQDVNNIPPETIQSINVLKGEKAISKYGQKGSSGVVEIWTKKDNVKDVKSASEPIPFTITGNSSNSTVLANSVIEGFGKKPLVIIDGVISEIQSPDKVPSDSIASISILKGESATILYGDKGKNGVVLITSKRGASTSKKGTSEIKVVGYGNDQKENQANTGFQIRSAGTSENEPKPLIVIDGVIAENQSMNKIDPETIESVSVIKNEVSTNKYGEKARNGVIEITLKHPEEMAVIVESLPEFPGGVEALKKFVAESMQYPAVALEKGIQGKVMVSFVVSNTGEIINVKVKSGVDVSLDKEAMRIVKSMPRWIPGKQNGEGVKVPYQIPINFSLPPKKISNEKLK
jgi:TonB family protein